MKEEIKRVCEIKEVSHAAMQLCERENKNQIALMVYNQETEEIKHTKEALHQKKLVRCFFSVKNKNI